MLIPIGLSHDLLSIVNSNFCSRMHRLAAVHNFTDDDDRRRQTTDATL